MTKRTAIQKSGDFEIGRPAIENAAVLENLGSESPKKLEVLMIGALQRAVEPDDDESEKGLETILALVMAHRARENPRTSSNTEKAYRVALRRFVRWCRAEGVTIHRITDREAERFVSEVADESSIATTRVVLAAVRSLWGALYRWAPGRTRFEGKNAAGEATKRKRPNPFDGIKAKGRPAELRNGYTPAEFAKLVAAAEDLETRALVHVAGDGGLRITEALFLDWKDVSFDDDGTAILHVLGKGSKVRDVPIVAGPLREFYKAEGSPRSGRVFVVYQGDRKETPSLNPKTLHARARARLLVLCKAARIRYLGWHSLRHFAGTRAENAARDNGRTAQVLLGHADASTTQRYIREAKTWSLLDQARARAAAVPPPCGGVT